MCRLADTFGAWDIQSPSDTIAWSDWLAATDTCTHPAPVLQVQERMECMASGTRRHMVQISPASSRTSAGPLSQSMRQTLLLAECTCAVLGSCPVWRPSLPVLSGRRASPSIHCLKGEVPLCRAVVSCQHSVLRSQNMPTSLHNPAVVVDQPLSPLSFGTPLNSTVVPCDALPASRAEMHHELQVMHVLSMHSLLPFNCLCLYRLSQNESTLMDPQGRILLEQCSLALNDAEARTEHPAERETGVYVGVMHMEYIQYMTGECPASQT